MRDDRFCFIRSQAFICSSCLARDRRFPQDSHTCGNPTLFPFVPEDCNRGRNRPCGHDSIAVLAAENQSSTKDLREIHKFDCFIMLLECASYEEVPEVRNNLARIWFRYVDCMN